MICDRFQPCSSLREYTGKCLRNSPWRLEPRKHVEEHLRFCGWFFVDFFGWVLFVCLGFCGGFCLVLFVCLFGFGLFVLV